MMTSYYFLLAVLQIAVVQNAYGQCLNRIRPACAETYDYIPNVYMNPNFVPNIPNVIPAVPNVIPAVPSVIPAVPSVIPTVPTLPYELPNQITPTTVVQDSTVANNLANALQLLVVSSLLSNTLPSMNTLPPYPYPYPYDLPAVPNVPYSPCGCGPYNYMY